MFSNEIFASRLLALCKEKNVTQQILADQLGLSFHQVSKMEAGQRGASLEVAYALADFFNCSCSSSSSSIGTTASTPSFPTIAGILMTTSSIP